MVYVLNKNGQPLMPTNRHGKVKHLLKDGKAKVIKRCPFTIFQQEHLKWCKVWQYEAIHPIG